MNNEPVAWMQTFTQEYKGVIETKHAVNIERIGINDIPLYTHPAQELNDGGEPVKNASYWKRQYNEMSALNDRLKSSLYHANEQIKYLEFHPAKTQLSNGHLSDCAIHNEPARKNKDCNCGFEPKFDLSGLKHEDNCRYFDDGMFCTCGADNHALVEWYRHKEVTHPSKDLTDEEILECKEQARKQFYEMITPQEVNIQSEILAKLFARAILRKANEK